MTHESITIIWDGRPHTFQKGSPNFVNLRNAIHSEDWDSIKDHLTPSRGVEKWSNDKFKLEGNSIIFNGQSLPEDITRRILDMSSRGEDPSTIFNFWERLQKNPSFRSVQQLWSFLKHRGIPLTEDGCFLAYKGVNDNYKDCHTGTVDNSPGTTHEMPRNMISDDPNHACHFGFHVGARRYATSFGSRVVICKIDPEHVVCVPYDSSQEKMRVCKYEVIGNEGEELPSTVYKEEDKKPEFVHMDDSNKDPDDFDPEDGEDDPFDHGHPEDEEDEDEVTEHEVKGPDDQKVITTTTKKAKKLPKNVKDKFRRMAKLGLAGLMGKSIDELRSYATYGLDIIGASKIPGGKTALTLRIMKVRDGKKDD